MVYYGAEQDKAKYDAATEGYEERVWDILNEFRIEISRSRRLVSEKVYEDLRSLYQYVAWEIDPKIREIIKKGDFDKQMMEEATVLSERFATEVSQRIDDEIDRLASELGLKVRTPAKVLGRRKSLQNN